MKQHLIFSGIALLSLASCMAASSKLTQDPNGVNLHHLMTNEIAMSSNTLWAVQSLDAELEWQGLEIAADTMILASKKIVQGGVRLNGSTITSSGQWEVFARQLVDAASDLKVAIAQRNSEDYFDASDRLYPPCESCHQHYLLK